MNSNSESPIADRELPALPRVATSPAPGSRRQKAGMNRSVDMEETSNGQYRPIEGFISKVEVAARLGKTARTVEQWMQRGVIPYIKIGNGRRATVLFKWADIEAHLKNNFGVGCNSE